MRALGLPCCGGRAIPAGAPEVVESASNQSKLTTMLTIKDLIEELTKAAAVVGNDAPVLVSDGAGVKSETLATSFCAGRMMLFCDETFVTEEAE